MTKQFIQVSAHKDSLNFAHCSNLSLMANGMTAAQALTYLNIMAEVYAENGYKVEWIRHDFDAVEEEMYGALFDTEAAEWELYNNQLCEFDN